VQTRLLEALEESPSTHAQAYLAAAVGIVGDVSAIGPLTQILDDEGRDPRLRAFAAAALGRIADPDRLPWNAVLARGLNYRHAPASLFDGSGRGALELL
jgi:HEAT repeat protein